MITILIIEDDIDLSSQYSQIIDLNHNLTLIGVTNSSSQGIELVKNFSPDVIILDLELHKGSGSGIEFLHSLKNLSPSHVPYVIVATNNTSAVTLEYARNLGCDFIFSKYEDDFSPNKIINFIIPMENIIHNKRPVNETVTKSSTEEIRIDFLKSTFAHLGISPKLKGYNYLIKSIMLVADNPSANYANIVACEEKKSIPSVEHAMTNSIRNAWTKSDIDLLQKYYPVHFSYTQSCPTLKEFVFFYADCIRNNCTISTI